MQNNYIPINQKFALTINEAKEYFNIGKNNLYKLVREDVDNSYHIKTGAKTLIIREALEKKLIK